MKKTVLSLALGLVLTGIPASILAACNDIIVVRDKEGTSQTCMLNDSYVINGVEFCEYKCSDPRVS
ncbi:MAG TPA: hypothetical protein VK892_22085 [Pyrinomonadaceae bacterium]|nr:hypothetical protein [Pyrinomonadaceae bacterium]